MTEPDVLTNADKAAADLAGLAMRRMREGWPKPSDRYFLPYTEAHSAYLLASRVHLAIENVIARLETNGCTADEDFRNWLAEATEAKAQAGAALNNRANDLWRNWLAQGVKRGRIEAAKDRCRQAYRRLLAVALFRESR